MDQYTVRFEPSGNHWILTGPVGAKGFLRFTSTKDAASHARWAARSHGGFLTVYGSEGGLLKEEEIKPGPNHEIARIQT